MDTEETRTCARCGKTQPLDQFDARFIRKETRLLCAHCRCESEERRRVAEVARKNAADEALRARREAIEQARSARLLLLTEDARRDHVLKQEIRLQLRGASRTAFDARLQQYDAELRAQDIASTQRNHILMQAWRVGRRTSAGWEEIKRRFEALDPPYTLWNTNKRRRDNALKRSLFTHQLGRCYYCGVELLPLDMPYNGPAEYRSARHAENALLQSVGQERPDNRDGIRPLSPYAEDHTRFKELDALWKPLRLRRADLEHIRPLSRGGSDTLENLALACNRCNIQKSVRTPEEFRQMPHDQVTRLMELSGMQLGDLARAVQYECENLYGFAEVCAELRILLGS